MRHLLYIVLSSIILVGCNQDGSSEDDAMNQDEASEENTAENDSVEESSEEETDTQAENDGSGNGNTNESDTDNTPTVDLMDDMSFIEGYWINYSGVDDPRGHMARTDFIPYDPEKEYTVTASSYVSYYYGEAFIKTNNYGHNTPLVIENVPEADRLIVSVNQADTERISLYDEALEDAESGEEANTTPEALVGEGRLVEENLTGQIMFGQEFLAEENLTMGERINDDGSFIEDEDYAVTEALEYDPSASYAITVPAYINYYSGRNFIETAEIEDAPAYIPQVSGADYINISFGETYMYELNVIEAE